MDQHRWEQLKDIFALVVDSTPHEAQAVLLNACTGDEQARLILEPLVEEHFCLSGAADARPIIDFIGSGALAGRFRLLTRLGSGAFGDVYRAIDTTTQAELAVKVLRSPTSLPLEYFKREFRSLADIRHTNIVALHELIAEGDRWLFSMDLVEGVDFLQFITKQPAEERDGAIRSLLGQLSNGVQELHDRGLIHRDLKPSNVLVTQEGRLIILDFGLVRPFGEGQPEMTFAGTPDYISPEQAAGHTAGEPADWYAVGVMLYQALTTQLPFVGGFLDVLGRKQIERPTPPFDMGPGVAPDLSALCMQLLDSDPFRRASYDSIRNTIAPRGVEQPRTAPNAIFVGRRHALEQLIEAHDTARDRPVLLHLRGPSGIGKTLLIREFLRDHVAATTVVFAGRCYQGQSVPYQTLDDVIDHIAQFLRRLPREQLEQCLPRNFGVLVRMFPVLGQFSRHDVHASVKTDSAELRMRAFGALRELLGRIAERFRVVIVVDDLQWGDQDGCAALGDLLCSADSPSILVILAYRTDDIKMSWLSTFGAEPISGSDLRTVFVDLSSLTEHETEELAASLLGYPVGEGALKRVGALSGGNPFLVHEIVRWFNARGLNSDFSIADVVRSRMESLDDESRRLLELVAVAGRPTPPSVFQAAGGLGHVIAARDALIAGRLIRSRLVEGREELEVYHDQIRGAVDANLTDDVRVARHRECARALQTAGADPERIAKHFDSAKEPALCRRYALEAAARAADALAFNKVADLLKLALSTNTLEKDELRVAHRQLADALANAGRGAEAAESYLQASRDAPFPDRLVWMQRAAEQLLYSGRVDRGLAIFEEVLGHIGRRLPRPQSTLPLGLLCRRLQLTLRGLRWRDRDPKDLSAETLLDIDTCSAVATGLALVDVARGAALQTTSLLLALRAGEPVRVARALAMEAGYRSSAGVRAERQAAVVLEKAEQLAMRTGDPRAIGLTAVMAAACSWSVGHWEECVKRAGVARAALAGRHERVTWERDTAAIFEVDGLRWMGRWAIMKAILPELLADARSRGDLYAEAILQMHGGSCAALAEDHPDRARTGLDLLKQWSNSGFHVEHLVEMHNQIEIALYEGNGGEAANIANDRWRSLRRSLLLRVQNFSIQMRSVRGRATVAAAINKRPSDRRELLGDAWRDIRTIRREKTIWGNALADLIQGSVEHCSGDVRASIASFVRADAAARASGMLLHAAVARRCVGLLSGNSAGAAALVESEAVMRAEGIVSVQRFSAMIAPGV